MRVVLDKKGGITVNECAFFNNELSQFLDEEDIINEEYLLEVSSPGLDRKLKKDSDFVWAVGKNVKINTYGPIDGKNTFSGRLLGLGVDTVVIDEGESSVEIPRNLISKAQVIPDIDWNKI